MGKRYEIVGGLRRMKVDQIHSNDRIQHLMSPDAGSERIKILKKGDSLTPSSSTT
jgi:hypothetical protein